MLASHPCRLRLPWHPRTQRSASSLVLSLDRTVGGRLFGGLVFIGTVLGGACLGALPSRLLIPLQAAACRSGGFFSDVQALRLWPPNLGLPPRRL